MLIQQLKYFTTANLRVPPCRYRQAGCLQEGEVRAQLRCMVNAFSASRGDDALVLPASFINQGSRNADYEQMLSDGKQRKGRACDIRSQLSTSNRTALLQTKLDLESINQWTGMSIHGLTNGDGKEIQLDVVVLEVFRFWNP